MAGIDTLAQVRETVSALGLTVPEVSNTHILKRAAQLCGMDQAIVHEIDDINFYISGHFGVDTRAKINTRLLKACRLALPVLGPKKPELLQSLFDPLIDAAADKAEASPSMEPQVTIEIPDLDRPEHFDELTLPENWDHDYRPDLFGLARRKSSQELPVWSPHKGLASHAPVIEAPKPGPLPTEATPTASQVDIAHIRQQLDDLQAKRDEVRHQIASERFELERVRAELAAARRSLEEVASECDRMRKSAEEEAAQMRSVASSEAESIRSSAEKATHECLRSVQEAADRLMANAASRHDRGSTVTKFNGHDSMPHRGNGSANPNRPARAVRNGKDSQAQQSRNRWIKAAQGKGPTDYVWPKRTT